MTRAGVPVLDGVRIGRWTAAGVPWWVPRVVLVVGWVASFVVAAVGDTSSCTAADPGVCGPDTTFAVALVVLFATPVLLWWMPLAGCGAGVLFAVLDLVYDDVPAARVAFAVHGLLCLGVAVWLVVARRRQAAVVAEVAGTIRLDAALTARLRDELSGWGLATVAAALLIAGGVGGLAWYGHRDAQVAAHEAAARRVAAVVRSADDASGVVVVDVPQPMRVDVIGSYEVGQVVPVLIDGSWVRLVAEPEDVTAWLSAGLGAFALAGLLLFREQRVRSARRRLLGGPLSAVKMTAEPDDGGRVVLYDGMAVVSVVASPIETDRPHLTGEDGEWDEGWWAEEPEDFGRHWRGDGPPDRKAEPWTVTVGGDLRDGGWVLLVTDTAVLLPEAPVRTPRRRRRAEVEAPFGEPMPAADPGELPALPVVLRPRPRTRALGALLLLGFAAGPAVVLAGLPENWWQTVVFLWLGGTLTYDGWSRLTARIELTRGGLVVHDRARVHSVPWERFHGVRRDDKGLWLAWDPDITLQARDVTNHWGAVMMRLHERALAAGDPGGQVTGRMNAGLAVCLAYTVVAVASVWWQYWAS
ncbi:hypothetical protein ACGFJ7_27755 [Actinoplanes sp. NPDC048988]|uniref:hypothetical protein n=1 Tax=Actinoplanes sp. NPDC048988 TaxID=3363901 RepID=UPI0037204D77